MMARASPRICDGDAGLGEGVYSCIHKRQEILYLHPLNTLGAFMYPLACVLSLARHSAFYQSTTYITFDLAIEGPVRYRRASVSDSPTYLQSSQPYLTLCTTPSPPPLFSSSISALSPFRSHHQFPSLHFRHQYLQPHPCRPLPPEKKT